MTPYGVVYFSSVDWDFRKQDHQFIATEFGARGRPVVFVENTGARLPSRRDLDRVTARLRNWSHRRAAAATPIPSGIEVRSPLCIPGARTRVERAINLALLRAQIGASVGRLPSGARVLWVGLPTWTSLDVHRWLRPDLLVYYCGDAFTELPGLRSGIAASERAVARNADLVFATSGALVEHCRSIGADPILVPVAIDIAASRATRDQPVALPSELQGLRGRLIGYMGGLNYKVDTDLLNAVSRRFPDDTLVILGSIEDGRYRPRGSNVVILGERPYKQIGAYLSRFDVCLIPYRVNDFTASVSPAKLLEYLAVGRPVVSTPLPEVQPYADVIQIAVSSDSFVDAVARVLDGEDSPGARAERQRRAERHSQQGVAGALIDEVERRLQGPRRGRVKDAVPGIGLAGTDGQKIR